MPPCFQNVFIFSFPKSLRTIHEHVHVAATLRLPLLSCSKRSTTRVLIWSYKHLGCTLPARSEISLFTTFIVFLSIPFVGTGRCPSGHQPMLFKSNCHRWAATCIWRSTYCIFIDILLLKTKNINTIIYFSLEQPRMNNMQRTSAIELFAVLYKWGFYLHHCQSQPQSIVV